MKPRSLRRPALAATFLAALVVSVGCYGSFPATRAVYKFNGSITKYRLVHSLVLIGFVIIPVYSICMLVDGIILNSIEFWSGDRISVAQSQTLEDDTVVTLAPGSHDDEALLTVERHGETILRRTYLRIDSHRTNILDEQGQVVAIAARDSEGNITLTNEAGEQLAAMDHSEIVAMAGR